MPLLSPQPSARAWLVSLSVFCVSLSVVVVYHCLQSPPCCVCLPILPHPPPEPSPSHVMTRRGQSCDLSASEGPTFHCQCHDFGLSGLGGLEAGMVHRGLFLGVPAVVGNAASYNTHSLFECLPPS